MVGRLCVAPVEAQFATEIVVQVIKRGFDNTEAAMGTNLVWLACSRAHVLLIWGCVATEEGRAHVKPSFFFRAYQAKLYGRSALISLIMILSGKRRVLIDSE